MQNYIDDKSANNAQIAYNLCKKDYTYEELVAEFETGNIIKKQLCILNLPELKTQEDAEKLVFNLTGQDGRIREATAYKINELIRNNLYKRFFQTNTVKERFIKGITDVNPTICRFVIDSLEYIDDKEYIINALAEQISAVMAEIEGYDKLVKKHVLNKKIFKIYWSLEALISTVGREFSRQNLPSMENGKWKMENYFSFDVVGLKPDLLSIAMRAAGFPDYTIREKAYRLLLTLKNIQNSNTIEQLIQQLENDENFYVKLR